MGTNGIYIPDRFRQAIVTHVACNYLANEFGEYPLILGIHGPPGTGKTFQCEQVLNALGVRTTLVSAADMEHEDAGTPPRRLREEYIAASKCIQEGAHYGAALLLNDIDTGLGDWGLQGTMNRQLLFGELMRFADNPHCVGNVATQRVPLFITGNDFTNLYYPLLRPGRTTLFEWLPTLEEKLAVIRGIFPECEDQLLIGLVRIFQQESVGFFVELRASLFRELVSERTNHMELGAILPWLQKHRRTSTWDINGSLDVFATRGKILQVESRLVNHLKRGPLDGAK